MHFEILAMFAFTNVRFRHDTLANAIDHLQQMKTARGYIIVFPTRSVMTLPGAIAALNPTHFGECWDRPPLRATGAIRAILE